MPKGFQAGWKHRLKPCPKPSLLTSNGRYALTFRFRGEFQPTMQTTAKSPWTPILPSAASSAPLPKSIEWLTYKAATDLFYGDLQGDVTKLFGKTYNNNGRRSATYTSGGESKYFYGGKARDVHSMTSKMKEICDAMSTHAGLEFNWFHVVFYPNNNCGIGWHSDNERNIGKNSAILGLVLNENPDNTRNLEFKSC